LSSFFVPPFILLLLKKLLLPGRKLHIGRRELLSWLAETIPPKGVSEIKTSEECD